MAQQPEPAPAQEPGIGGPVDLAGIERYQRIRTLAVALLAAAMIATVVANILLDLNWPTQSPFDGAPSFSGLVMQGFIWALFVLVIDAGNRLETRLACLGALWAIVAGTLATLGADALLSLVATALPRWTQVAAGLLAGYAVVLPLAVPLLILSHRRRKRLVRADGG